MADADAESIEMFKLSDDYDRDDSHLEYTRLLDIDPSQDGFNAVFENPLAHIDEEQLMLDVEHFCKKHGLLECVNDIKKGAKISKDPESVPSADWLSEEEKQAILEEKIKKWKNPWMLYWLTCWCF